MTILKRKKRVLKLISPLIPRIRPRLKPLSDIQETHQANTGNWVAKGDDPQFLCEFPLVEPHTGWYLISVKITSSAPVDVAKFYIDTGEGFNEVETISIPYKSGAVAKRFARFSRTMKRMRFDPQCCAGAFEISGFSITPVTFKFAESRMLRKLTRSGSKTVSVKREYLQEIAQENSKTYEQILLQQYSVMFAANHSYQHWIDSVEMVRLPRVADIESTLANDQKPLLSVIMPICNTAPELLRSTIESVLSQSYTHWQLCISDDASTNAQTLDMVREYAARDDRIEVVYQSERSGIALNTNAALQIAVGDYCLFLDHDDLLARHAMHEVATLAIDRPEVKLIYSDEDKLDIQGVRIEPHFKPDWNPDLLLAQNYICHLCVIRRDVLSETGFCRAGFEGAQDHDLLLRVTKGIGEQEVHHIPKILYHWRMTPDSTASSASAKDYSTDSGIAAVSDFLASCGEEAVVTAGRFPNTYRVRREIPEPKPKVSIIIPTRDGLNILSQCIESIQELTDYPEYEIIVVDNRSVNEETHDYFKKIRRVENIRVLGYDNDFNYSAINNFAVEHANGSVIVLLNNDIEVISPEWLDEMVSHAIRPTVGCVGAKLLYKNNMVQHAGVILGIGGVAGHAHKYFDAEAAGYFSRLHLTQNLSAVTAACLAVEKKIFDAAGGLNENDLKVAFNDVDFCLRVGALGLRNVWTPYAELYHHESVSRGSEDTHEKQLRFASEASFMQKKWGNKLISDPAYNRNLTRSREDFSLAA